jgi:hypothetical protein
MTNNSATEHTVPAALITHCTAIIRGHHDADITAHHARTSDARLTMTWGGVLLTVYTAAAAHGLLEGFVAARAAAAQLPREIPHPQPATRRRSPARSWRWNGPAAGLRRRRPQRARQDQRPGHPLGRFAHGPDHLADPRPGRAAQRHRLPHRAYLTAGPYVIAPHSQRHVRCRPHEHAMLPTNIRPGRKG